MAPIQQRVTNDANEKRNPAWKPRSTTSAAASAKMTVDPLPKGSIAFTTVLLDHTRHVELIDTDGQNRRPLTDPKVESYDAAWSPDANQIAFVSTVDGAPAIFVANADASNRRRVT